MFVECAVGVGAEYLVSGDDDLLAPGRVACVAIVSPARFLAALDA